MKIELDIDDKYPDTDIKITAPRLTQDIEKIISFMRILDRKITAKKDDETYLLDAEKILYIEAVERNTFIYTTETTYESDLKLYELEQELLEQDFIRISKQSIVNLRKVKRLISTAKSELRC